MISLRPEHQEMNKENDHLKKNCKSEDMICEYHIVLRATKTVRTLEQLLGVVLMS